MYVTISHMIFYSMSVLPAGVVFCLVSVGVRSVSSEHLFLPLLIQRRHWCYYHNPTI